MFNTYQTALINPKRIATLLRNHIYRLIIFVITIIGITMIPYIVNASVNKGQLVNMQDRIQAVLESYTYRGSDENRMYIENGRLNNPQEKYAFQLENYHFKTHVYQTLKSSLGVQIVLDVEGIYVTTPFSGTKILSYEELGIADYEFVDISKGNTKKLASAMVHVTDNAKGRVITFQIITPLLFIMIIYFGGALILMTFSKGQFKMVQTTNVVRYQIAIYSMGISFIAYTLLKLIGIYVGLGSIIGIIIFWGLVMLANYYHRKAYQGIIVSKIRGKMDGDIKEKDD